MYGLHKSATMFLYRFYKRLANDRGYQFFSINNDPADHAQSWSELTGNYCVCPERSFDFSIYDRNSECDWRVIQIRDPRDILVSEYFSVGWIHGVADKSLEARRRQAQEMSIDEYVLNPPRDHAATLETMLEPLRTLDLDSKRTVVLRYETMVTDLPTWIREAIRPFSFAIPRWSAWRYTRKFEREFQAKSESLSHRRKMTPGDYREKLQPETIEQLNEKFGWFLKRFRY